MSTTAQEDKRTVASHEAKARDLQSKINALLCIEKDVRGCVEQLQTIEKEVRALTESEKELAELKDQLEVKDIEQTELNLRHEVCSHRHGPHKCLFDHAAYREATFECALSFDPSSGTCIG
jgi:DNA repair ATPase RecN